ncbi:hypothetical protein SNOUR_41760 [Streptomyces noursei ATCC 11455]|nr:hypothetical protein SNOUR_41760 [Streptomyces noursei ATCC 11455]
MAGGLDSVGLRDGAVKEYVPVGVMARQDFRQ